MKLNTILGIVAALLLLGGGIAFGMWLEKPTIDDLIERNRRLSAQDTLLRTELENERTTNSVLTDDFKNHEDAWKFAEDSLGAIITDLRQHIEDDHGTITGLASGNAALQDTLEDIRLTGVQVSDSIVSAELFTYKSYQDGSINAEGYITVFTPFEDEPYGSASLNFDIRMKPTVIMSRDESGLGTCDLTFGDMPVYVSDLLCVDNLGYEEPVKSDINWPTVGITAGIAATALIILAAIL